MERERITFGPEAVSRIDPFFRIEVDR